MIKSQLAEAIEVLREGGIVIYPTDTAFGIGCRIDNEKVIEKLFAIRNRPRTQATPVLVDSKEMARKYFQSPLPYNVRQLMDKYWPGALTIVYNCRQEAVSSPVRGNGSNVGLRMPNHEVPLKLIAGVKVPILGPSANFHGEPTPFEYKELDKNLMKMADYVIAGKCRLKNASTVVDCSITPNKITRQGAIIIESKFLS